jgi:hypothetical protein
MEDVMTQRVKLSTRIMSTLQQLHQRFPKNISFAIDEYGECNITINKDCFASNISMFKCRCCKTVLNFAKKFNENFKFLLELDTPLNFLKLSFCDKAHSVMRFNVTVKNNFFDSCGFTGLSDNFNPCNIEEDEFRNIVKTFYKILGSNPDLVPNTTDSSIPRMFDDDDAKKYRGGAQGGRNRGSQCSYFIKKYKKLRKNTYSNKLRVKKYNRRTKRRMGGGRRK